MTVLHITLYKQSIWHSSWWNGMIKEKMVSLVNSKWFMNLIYCLICHGIPSNVVDTKFFWLFQAYSCFYIMQWGQGEKLYGITWVNVSWRLEIKLLMHILIRSLSQTELVWLRDHTAPHQTPVVLLYSVLWLYGQVIMAWHSCHYLS